MKHFGTGVLSRRRLVILGSAMVAATLNACSSDISILEARPNGGARVSRSSQVDSGKKLINANHPRRVKNSYIVRFVDNADASRESERAQRELKAKPFKILKSLKGFWGEISDAGVSALLADPQVKSVEADVLLTVNGLGDTTQYSAPNYLDRVDQRSSTLDGNYEFSATGNGVHIWIVDNGVDQYDSEISSRVSTTEWSTSNLQDPLESCYGNGHGTSMARYAAGSSLGAARQAIIHSARVNQVGNCAGINSGAAVAALEFIGDYATRPAIANLSFSGSSSSCNSLCDAANYAISRGVTVVAAAGNDNSDACGTAWGHSSAIILVGAANSAGTTLGGNTNWGGCVDIFAPTPGQSSSATALTSGAAALTVQFFNSAPPASIASDLVSKSTTGVLSGLPGSSPNRLLYSKPADLVSWIEGASVSGQYASCSWFGFHSGGQPPYTYQWYQNSVPVATTVSYALNPVGSSDVSLQLLVTDRVGRTHFSMKSVTVDLNDYSFACTGS